MTTTPLDWTSLLLDQIQWHWGEQLRPRLDGLTDEEYLWEPVPRVWNLRPRGAAGAPIQAGAGEMVIDFEFPEPDPAPVTTIAWRLGHVIVGILAMRNASHFGAPPADYQTWTYAATADEALDQLDDAYERWVTGVAALDAEALAQPCGEHGFEQDPMARLVLHIHRELIHHGAEIALLRDLFAQREE